MKMGMDKFLGEAIIIDRIGMIFLVITVSKVLLAII